MAIGTDPRSPSESLLSELFTRVCCDCSLYGYVLSMKITSRLMYNFPLVRERHGYLEWNAL